MMPEIPPTQASFVLHFDPAIHTVSAQNQYLRQWIEIIEERKNRILDYPRLSQISARLDLDHISKQDRIYFQEYTEHLNRLLELDFPAVKERFFNGIWKLGAAVFSADPRQVRFDLYTISPGDPDIRVSGIADRRRISRRGPARLMHGAKASRAEGSSSTTGSTAPPSRTPSRKLRSSSSHM